MNDDDTDDDDDGDDGDDAAAAAADDNNDVVLAGIMQRPPRSRAEQLVDGWMLTRSQEQESYAFIYKHHVLS